MAESVLIALITFLSGAVGAVLGVVGVYVSSHHTAKIEMDRTVFAKLLDKRVEVYSEFYEAYSRFLVGTQKDKAELTAKLGAATGKAQIVASQKTSEELSKLLMALKNVDQMKVSDISTISQIEYNVRTGMEQDLRSFVLPRVVKENYRTERLKTKKERKRPKGK